MCPLRWRVRWKGILKDAGSGRVVWWGTKRYFSLVYEVLDVVFKDKAFVYGMAWCLMKRAMFRDIISVG